MTPGRADHRSHAGQAQGTSCAVPAIAVAIYAIRIGNPEDAGARRGRTRADHGYHPLATVIGLDGIGDDRYTCQAIALEERAKSCVVPFNIARSPARR